MSSGFYPKAAARLEYEARKHAQKEAEMGGIVDLKVENAARIAVALMEGDPATFKAGYTFENALIFACEHSELLGEPVMVAMVAAKMHEALS